MHRNFLQLFTLIFILSFVSLAQTSSLDDKLKEIDAYAQKVMADWEQPGMAIAIVKDDKVVFAKGYGVRELGKPDKVDENTLFAIASNSKAFTTAALAILVDEKKLNWNDKVTKYLPDFKMPDDYVTNEMTIRDIVSHRSGLATFSGDLLWYETTYSPAEVLRRVRYLKPTSSFPLGLWLSEFDVHRRRPGDSKSIGQTVGAIRQRTHSGPALDVAHYDQHQGLKGQRGDAAQ